VKIKSVLLIALVFCAIQAQGMVRTAYTPGPARRGPRAASVGILPEKGPTRATAGVYGVVRGRKAGIGRCRVLALPAQGYRHNPAGWSCQ